MIPFFTAAAAYWNRPDFIMTFSPDVVGSFYEFFFLLFLLLILRIYGCFRVNIHRLTFEQLLFRTAGGLIITSRR